MNPYLMMSIGTGPIVIRRLVELIPQEKYDEPLDRDRFTVREVIAHLADWESLFRGRMEAAIAAPMSPIIAYDEGERAIERNYAGTDIEVELDTYASERSKTEELLKSIGTEGMQKRFLHPNNGPTTILDQANMLIGHDMYHVEQLSAYLSQS